MPAELDTQEPQQGAESASRGNWKSINPPPLDPDDWELEEDLEAASRLVKSLAVHTDQSGTDRSIERLHPGADSARAPRTTSAAGAGGSDRGNRDGSKVISALFSWSVLSLGLMAFVFGGVLLGWSVAGGRADLWRLGMPFAMAGQAALIIGLVLQLDSLWRSNRAANETLSQLDDQIDHLRHATTLLSTTHSTAAQSFYVHMAEGAGPHLLLADLKGQLDLLATKLAEDR